MKTYAIKTPRGYFAKQGTSSWYQSTPDGWAAFCEAEHARQMMVANGITDGEIEEHDA